MERRSRTFRSVEDFLTVPRIEVGACVRCFEDWLLRCHELREAARRDGLDPDRLQFPEFTWHARAEPSSERPSPPYPATTDIRELGLRPSAMHELRTHNLYALEDFTQASEDELKAIPRVGRATVVQIHSYLQALGLDFKPSPRPGRLADIKARVARKLAPEERRVSDESHIADLGLKTFTVSRCMHFGLTDIRTLRKQSLSDLYRRFGKKSVLEIVETLEQVGLELETKPSQLEKWHYGAIARERLRYPGDEASVRELGPWLGSLCQRLERAGVATVREARSLALSGGKPIHGLGATSWERIEKHFGVHAQPGKAKPSKQPPSAWPRAGD